MFILVLRSAPKSSTRKGEHFAGSLNPKTLDRYDSGLKV